MRKDSVLKDWAKKIIAASILGIFAAGNALAMAVPASGSFAYDIYDIGVNQILLGPIGFIAGVGFIVLAAILALRNMYVPAGGIVLAAAFMLKADAVIQTFGGLLV